MIIFAEIKSNKMTQQKDSKKNKSTSFLLPFIIGGLFTYYILTPAIDGKFNSLFGGDKPVDKKSSHEAKLFNQIDGKVAVYRHYLFKKYFNKNSVSKYREYHRLNNYSNQLNPENDAYWQSRGYSKRPENCEEILKNDFNQTKDNWDNYSNQLNPNNDAYWQSRGYNDRPDDWQNETNNGSSNANMNNHANQMNPNNSAYSSSRGGNGSGGHSGGGKGK